MHVGSRLHHRHSRHSRQLHCHRSQQHARPAKRASLIQVRSALLLLAATAAAGSTSGRMSPTRNSTCVLVCFLLHFLLLCAHPRGHAGADCTVCRCRQQRGRPALGRACLARMRVCVARAWLTSRSTPGEARLLPAVCSARSMVGCSSGGGCCCGSSGGCGSAVLPSPPSPLSSSASLASSSSPSSSPSSSSSASSPSPAGSRPDWF